MLESNQQVSQGMSGYFNSKGMEMVCCSTANEAKAYLSRKGTHFDLAILAIRIGDDNEGGNEVINWMEQQGIKMPRIIIFEFDDEQYTEKVYDYNCEHRIAKPCPSWELYSSAEKAIANSQRVAKRGLVLSAGGITLDERNPCRYFKEGDETERSLPSKQYELLRVLMENAGYTCKKEVLVTEVWGHEYESSRDDDMLKKAIWKLRQEIGDKDKKLIETISDKGYRFNGKGDSK